MKTETETTTPTPTTTAPNWGGRVSIFYGAVGLAMISQFGAIGSWKSFALGWILAEINFELLRRLVTMMVAILKGERQIGRLFYALILGKFSLWAIILLMITTADWLQAVPFLLGISALIVAAFGLGIREVIYARTTRV